MTAPAASEWTFPLSWLDALQTVNEVDADRAKAEILRSHAPSPAWWGQRSGAPDDQTR